MNLLINRDGQLVHGTLAEFIDGKKVLRLTLKKQPFEVMSIGEKDKEYRNPSMWLQSRLYYRPKIGGCTMSYFEPREYDYVLFQNGYRKDSPLFLNEYKGFHINNTRSIYKYSNGLVVNVEPGDVVIELGAVVAHGHKYIADEK